MAPSADPSLDKISQGQPGLWRVLFNRRNIAGLAGAAVFGPGLQLGKTGAVAGYFLVRWVYSKTEQYVPFTKRRHIVLLPGVAGVCVGPAGAVTVLPGTAWCCTMWLLHAHVIPA